MATEMTSDTNVYTQLEAYDWDNDREFQAGLQSIVGSATSPQQTEHLTLRARCFYLSRKLGSKISFDDYLRWRSAQGTGNPVNDDVVVQSQQSSGLIVPPQGTTKTDNGTSTSASGPHGDAPTPATFAEICQLIAEGKPIPGIKEIPDTVLEGQATTSSAAKRRKPWEKDIALPTQSAAAAQ